jgi:WD40 repeat protein
VIVLQGPRERLDGVVLSPDGRLAACAGGSEGQLLLWDITAGRRLELNPPAVPIYRTAYAFSPDGRWLATGLGHLLRIYDSTTGRLSAELHLADEVVPALRWHPAGRLLASVPAWGPAAGDNLRWFDSTARMMPQKGFRTADQAVYGLAFARDGRTLVTRGTDGLNRWDVRRRRHLGHWPLADRDSSSLAASPDDRFAAVPQRSQLHVVDLTGQGGGMTVRHAPRKRFQGAAFTPDGRHLAAVGGSDAVRFWDTATWRERQSYNWGVGELRGVAFTADGLRGVAVSATGALVIWDTDL